MKRTALLIDDDALVHQDVKHRLKGLPQLTIAATCSSVDEALDYLEKQGEVDVIFCDIMMPGKDGYEANKLLAGYCRLFVFLTQKKSHGAEVYGTKSMVHYLRKPIDAATVSLLLAQLDEADKVIAETGHSKNFVFLYDRLSGNRVFVPVLDILMISVNDKYGEVTIADQEKKMLVYGTSVAIARKLKAAGWFVRISQNCIISAHAIDHIDKNLVIYFKWGGYEAVTRTYQAAFRAFMNRYGLG
ncbi:LytR/AlgR family response regulator transcription factor [Parapedobacter sp. DT-150]|uniref:LytR/AlgR family response regulator transcription factor n=1 Tax=Parapedobacter sp. DT-150 TaxID=3396162 RepID=UPI003F1D42A0